MLSRRQADVRARVELRRCELIQEIHGMGADSLLRESEEEICTRLVTKYESYFSTANAGEQGDVLIAREAFTITARENVARRKSNLFSGAVKRTNAVVKRMTA